MSQLLAEKPDHTVTTPVVVDRSHSNQLKDDDKIAVVSSIAEMLMRGERSTSTIIDFMKTQLPDGTCSRATALKYRNAAMALLEREQKPMNRENIRQLEIGRYTYLIERMYKVICQFEDATPILGRDVKWHDSYTKLWGKLNDLGARLHAITGLNEITINSGDDRKRITFVRYSPTPTGHIPSPPDTTNASSTDTHSDTQPTP